MGVKIGQNGHRIWFQRIGRRSFELTAAGSYTSRRARVVVKKANNFRSFLKANFMAKYHSGYLGPFDGKLGTAVGSRWKGIDYLRSIGRRRRTSTPSPKQQAQRRGSQGVSELTAANIT